MCPFVCAGDSATNVTQFTKKAMSFIGHAQRNKTENKKKSTEVN